MCKVLRSIMSLPLVAIMAVSCGPSQAQYDELVKENESLKIEVNKLTTALEASNAELIQYKTAPDVLLAEAQKCIDKKDIDGLKVVCAKFDKYHPATSEAQKARRGLVSLVKEKDQAIAAEKAKRQQAVNKLKKQYDDISGITWYYNPYFTHYNNSNHFSIYMGKRTSGKPWLNLMMSYYGDGWIFFDHAYLSYDGKTIEIPFNEYTDKKTENDTSCWEWLNMSVSDSVLAFLKKMVDGKSVKMRLSGKYEHTRNLSKAEINGVRDVLLAYDVLMHGE